MRAAVYSGTRNVYDNMVIAMKSLLVNSTIDKIYFLIEDEQFPYELPSKVECIDMSKQPWIRADCPNIYHNWGRQMNLIRLALAKIFPNLDKILSLDNDTFVLSDISNLWDIDLSNYYAAGVRDTAELNVHGLYINAGVVLYNLDKIRNDKIDDKLLQKVHERKRDYPMQDPLNEIISSKVYELPSQYNSCPAFMNYDPLEAKIIHFAGDRHYLENPLTQLYKNLKLGDKHYENSSIHRNT